MRKLAFLAAVLVLGLVSVLPLRIAAQEEPSLYDRLGGEEAIGAVVDELIRNVVADKRINHFFANADAARLRTLLVELICESTGGPCTYSGRSLREAHAGLGISDADFKALVQDLDRALDTRNVRAREKRELLALLAPLASDVVEVTVTPTATATAVARPQPAATSAPTARPTAAPTSAPAKPTSPPPGFIRYGPLGF